MKSLKVYLIIATALLIVYIIAQANRPKAIDWTETLSSKDKIPYGTYVLDQCLYDIFPKAQIARYRQPMYNVIAEDSIKNASYIIICPGIELSKSDYNQLIKYIKQGNDVFIAAKYFGTLLDKNLGFNTKFDVADTTEQTPLHFVSPALNPGKEYNVDKFTGNIAFNKFDTARCVVMSENANHQANFIKYTFGKGSLYLMSNPKLFSNYSLLKPQGAEYAATALSYLKNTGTIVLDQYYTQGPGGDESPMRVFLTNPTLQWAYYIAIFSLLIFVLYEVKRRQRVIPVITPLSNLTLDFVTTVGQVYYERHDNANIAQKKITYMLAYLRDEYQVKTNKIDPEFKELLKTKLAINADFTDEFVGFLNYISVQQQVNDRELIKLNELIEQFYMQLK